MGREPDRMRFPVSRSAVAGGAACLFLLGAAATAATRYAPATAAVPQKPAATAPAPAVASRDAKTFVNPICRNAADPWIVYHKGNYYLLSTLGNWIGIRKSPTLAGLGDVKPVQVWKGGLPGYEGYKEDLWAPELHYLNGKWYIYYCCTDGPDANRRVFCLEAKTDDPQGEYVSKGRLTPTDEDAYEWDYAIDATVYQRKKDGALFYLWSGRDRQGGPQNIYIAPLKNPWTISGPRTLLTTPEFDWEKHGWWVNEGPEVLERNGKTFVVYSGSGGTTPYYCLGLLTNTDGNLLNAASWSKAKQPVFSSYEGPEGAVYTTAHNGFFRSPDGKEDWIVYHGKDNKDGTWGGRHARAQRFTWRADDTPDFGRPLVSGVPVTIPSGEKAPAVLSQQ